MASVMPPSSADLLKKIYEQVSNDSVTTIVLVGDSGVGKTWMAKKLSNRAIREKLFDIVLWVFLNRKYDDEAVVKSIARQLSLLSTAEESEDEDGNKEAKEEEEENWEKLKDKISATLEGKRFLLICDAVRSDVTEEEMSKLKTLLHLNQQGSYKVLITTVNNISGHFTEGNMIDVNQLSEEESKSFLIERVKSTVCQLPGVKDLADTYIKKSKGLPGEIIVMAKAMNCLHDSRVQVMKDALEEASDNVNCNIMKLLRSEYVMLPQNVLIDCCCPGNHFFLDRGSVHFNELIAYWILEGYLGHGNSIEKAYEKGHHVLVELIDCQMLKMLEAGYVTMDRSMINLDDYHRCGFGGTANLGLANVLEEVGESKGLGIITKADGMIKTLRSGKEGQKLSTLLLDGNRFCRETPNEFLQSKHELQVLALFNPILQSLSLPLTEMPNLIVLVLRGCDFLENIDHNLELKKLTVLEISGSTSKTIPDDLFKNTPHIRSLNLSALQIDSLPLSFYDLSGLVWIILRGCSRLKTLRSLKKFTKLTVLDLSGATSLTNIIDKTFFQNPELAVLDLSQTQIQRLPLVNKLGKLTHLLLSGCTRLPRLRFINSVTSLQVLDLSGASIFEEFHDRSLEKNVQLKIIDLSGTLIDHHQLPLNISNPHHLYLKGCSRLEKLPCIKALKDLKVLDLSGTSGLFEIADDFLKQLSHLRVLNLSETKIIRLSSLPYPCNLRHLLLSRCSCLVELPDLNSVKKLEVLDLSGCSALTGIQASFEQMFNLQRLDLSETKIECLPILSNPSNLRYLLLEKCSNLKKLPPLESLSKLEELNLCGVSLRETGADFLEHMSCLQILNLSETLLKCLPSMSNLRNLKNLSLRGCSDLQTVPLEALTKLEILDLSGTAVRDLPNLNSCSNLRQLLLRDCSSLTKLHWEMPDLLGETVAKLPYGISELTHLEYLDLPYMKNFHGAESSKIMCQPKELNQHRWNISILSANSERHPIPVSSTQFFQLLEKNPSLWEPDLKRFHYCVHPMKGKNKTADRYLHEIELIFRDIYFRTSQFARFRDKRSLQVRGFHNLPKGIEGVLHHTDCLLLVDNTFKRLLSNLSASNLNVLKGCWIERCNEMESIFDEKEEEDNDKLGKTLEILGVSNAINLKSIYSGNLPCKSFQNLAALYLDGCPMLSTVFSSSLLLVNLKVLQIKFCDKLETLFEETSSEHKFPNLDTLHLLELSELRSIGCTLPSLQTLKVWECPKLLKLEENIELAKLLQNLWICNVIELKSLDSGNLVTESFKNLEVLKIESCPKLVDVLSSSQRPENIKTLQIKSCDMLETVFAYDTAGCYQLPKLCTLHLLELPKLKSIGGIFPSLQDRLIVGCPNC